MRRRLSPAAPNRLVVWGLERRGGIAPNRLNNKPRGLRALVTTLARLVVPLPSATTVTWPATALTIP
jgi:hypothetical protein